MDDRLVMTGMRPEDEDIVTSLRPHHLREYIGQDAFAEGYAGFVPFSNGSWIKGDTAYDSGKKQYLSLSGTQQKITAEFQKEMANTVQEFITINNLILESDYYQEKTPGIF